MSTPSVAHGVGWVEGGRGKRTSLTGAGAGMLGCAADWEILGPAKLGGTAGILLAVSDGCRVHLARSDPLPILVLSNLLLLWL